MRRIALPLVTSLLFAGSFVAAKITTAELEPLTTTLLRYAVAWLFLSVLVVRSNSVSLSIRGRDVATIALIGLFGIVGYHYFFFVALRHTEVTNTAIVNSLSPVVTALAAAIILRERLSGLNYAGIGIAFAGVLWLLARGDPGRLIGLQVRSGDALMLVSVLCWVVYALMVRRMLTRYSSLTLTWYAALFAVLMLIGLAATEPFMDQVRNLSLAAMLSLLYMGLGASGLGYLLYNRSIETIGPTRTSSFVYSLVPIQVAILAWLAFDQAVTATMIVSMIVIVVGLDLMRRETATEGY